MSIVNERIEANRAEFFEERKDYTADEMDCAWQNRLDFSKRRDGDTDMTIDLLCDLVDELHERLARLEGPTARQAAPTYNTGLSEEEIFERALRREQTND